MSVRAVAGVDWGKMVRYREVWPEIPVHTSVWILYLHLIRPEDALPHLAFGMGAMLLNTRDTMPPRFIETFVRNVCDFSQNENSKAVMRMGQLREETIDPYQNLRQMSWLTMIMLYLAIEDLTQEDVKVIYDCWECVANAPLGYKAYYGTKTLCQRIFAHLRNGVSQLVKGGYHNYDLVALRESLHAYLDEILEEKKRTANTDSEKLLYEFMRIHCEIMAETYINAMVRRYAEVLGRLGEDAVPRVTNFDHLVLFGRVHNLF